MQSRIDVSVSTTSTFREDDHPINETLDGGRLQFKLHSIPDDRYWIPLGRIDHLSRNPSDFRDRYTDADEGTPDEEYTNGACTEDIYYDGS